jgi:hypothetical protein
LAFKDGFGITKDFRELLFTARAASCNGFEVGVVASDVR